MSYDDTSVTIPSGFETGSGSAVGPWEQTQDWGYAEWNPGAEQLIDWVEHGGMSMEDVAEGFGFDPSMHSQIAGWEDYVIGGEDFAADIASKKEDIVTAGERYTESTEDLFKGFEGTIEAAREKTSGSLYEAMETSRGRLGQSRFTGVGSRTRDRALTSTVGAYKKTVSGESDVLEKGEKSALWDKEDKVRSANIGIRGVKKEIKQEKYDWYDELMRSIGGLAGRGVEQRTVPKPEDYTRSGSGGPSDLSGDEHGDSYFDTDTGQAWRYQDPQGWLSNGYWMTQEDWDTRAGGIGDFTAFGMLDYNPTYSDDEYYVPPDDDDG